MSISFVSCIFGERYVPFLITNVYSVFQHHPDAEYRVYYTDVQDDVMQRLQATYPRLVPVRRDIELKSLHNKSKLNNKICFWRMGHDEAKYNQIAFIDVDTLLVRPLDVFSRQFDLAFTRNDSKERPAKVPLNTGVVFCQKRRPGTFSSSDFFLRWEIVVQDFMENSKKYTEAYKIYGSGDQLAIALLLGHPIDMEGSKRYGSCEVLWLKGSEYNNDCSVRLEPSIRILHYKSKWHSILLDGRDLDDVETRREFGEIKKFYDGLAVAARLRDVNVA